MSEVVRCKAQVWHPRAWRPSQCQKDATRDGWCGTHHPDAEKRRRDAFEARISAERAHINAKHEEQRECKRRADCFDDLLAALKTLAAEEHRDDDDPALIAARERAAAAIAKAEAK